MRKLIFILGVVLMATVLTSCVKEKEVTGISLDKTTLTIPVGEWQTLNATVSPKKATNKTVAWATSNRTIASVVDGIVIGNTAGKAIIIAKAGDYTATCEVTVINGLEGSTWKGIRKGEAFTVTFTDGIHCTATQKWESGTSKYSGTYTFVNQNVAFTFIDEFYTYAFVGTVSGDKMTLQEGGKTIVLTKQ